MKKILLTLLVLILISKLFINNSDRLYGIRLYDDVGDWVYIPRYKPWKKAKSSVDGYYSASVPTRWCPTPSWYKEAGINRPDIESFPRGRNWCGNVMLPLYVTFGEDNKIVEITFVYPGFENSRECEVAESVVRKDLENEYNIEMERNLDTRYGFQKWMGDNLLETNCLDHSNSLLISLLSKEYFTKNKEHHNSKI